MGRKPKEPREEIKYPGVRSENGRHTYRYSVPVPGKKEGNKRKLLAIQQRRKLLKLELKLKPSY